MEVAQRTTGAVWVVIISLARCGASRTGCSLRVRAAFVAQRAELLIYDLDDNLV